MAKDRQDYTDIAISSPIIKGLPASWRPFALMARWDRPIGGWLLLLPCWQGLLLAQSYGVSDWGQQGQAIGWFDLALYALIFFLGAFLMRGAGCCWNDLADHKLDAKVERTALRPLPSGQVTRRASYLFMAGQALTAFLLTLFFLPASCVLLAIISLPLVLIYPFMKRISWFPQAWLGLTFNWGALMGFVVIYSVFDNGWAVFMPALLLYAAGWCWTMGYDTIYALQDSEDDALAGIKSTARFFGPNVRAWVALFYGLQLCLYVFIGAHGGFDLFYYLILGLFGIHIFWQIHKIDLKNQAGALYLFKANKLAGALVCAAFFSQIF